MTKLEQKLIELGYKQGLKLITRFYKDINCDGGIVITLDCKFSRIVNYYVEAIIQKEQDLEASKQEFEQLQSDLKELKEYE